MQQTNEIKISLKREYNLYSNAMAFYKNTLKAFEQKLANFILRLS